ncbi:MAG: biopolymer transporter ExbD [Verrucomicrobia bacterium]|nr:biopolymer transporter ExbD [Verrucomicrobiota bacterium]
MKLPRNVRIFRGQLDAAPFASVLFLMIIFMTLSSKLLFVPGVKIQLPAAGRANSGFRDASVPVAVDSANQLHYESQAITKAELTNELRKAVLRAREPLTLEIQADRAASMDTAFWLMSVAGELGFKDALLVSTSQPLPPVVNGVTP